MGDAAENGMTSKLNLTRLGVLLDLRNHCKDRNKNRLLFLDIALCVWTYHFHCSMHTFIVVDTVCLLLVALLLMINFLLFHLLLLLLKPYTHSTSPFIRVCKERRRILVA